MSAYDSPLAHQQMVFDEVRNSAYASAIRAAVTPESVVLDLGCGLGLLGLIAAQAGARHVYMVDPAPVIHMARKIAAANGLEGRVSFIQGKVEEVQLPEQVDVIISVMTGNFLLGEDLLPSLFYARDHFLKPGGALIPHSAEMRMAPARLARLHERSIPIWSEPAQGIRFGPMRQIAANSVAAYRLSEEDYQFLAPPQSIHSIDLHTASNAGVKTKTRFELEQEGPLHGYIGWFRLQLGNQQLSTGPQHEATHWLQAILPIDPPLHTAPGASLSVSVTRPQHGEWSWVTRYGDEQRKHSGFFARGLSKQRLAFADPDHRPQLSQKGQLALHVLKAAAAGLSIGEIRAAAAGEFDSMFADHAALETEIARILTANGAA